MLLMIKPHPFLLVPIFLLVSSTLISHGASSTDLHFQFNQSPGTVGESENGVVGWGMRRSVLENSSMILAAKRTRRRDPLNNLTYYTGGWNITNKHYFSSAGFTVGPFFLIAAIWFVGFGLCLLLIFCCFCCCRREPCGYSPATYALSLVLLSLFTIAAIIGCVVLYTGQGKFHRSTSAMLDYVVLQADTTVERLGNVSDCLVAAKSVGIKLVSLPTNIGNNIAEQKKNIGNNITNVGNMISAAATTLQRETQKNKNNMEGLLDSVRLALIIIAAVMLLLALLGFLLSLLGFQFLVYTLVIMGWILVAGMFISAGVFLLLHNMVGDMCVAMDEWIQNPTAHTALDDILPCVDNATAQATWTQSKEVTYQLVELVNTAITNVSNRNFPPSAPNPPYFNQSGPLVPVLCNPFNADLSYRTCTAGEVDFENATQVWHNYVCEVSSNNSCTTAGRLTPTMYSQIVNDANVSYGLNHYGPFLVGLLDCSFVRETFTSISQDHCPYLRQYSMWVYIGLAMVAGAVMLSLIFWVIYVRERRHRKKLD